MVFMVASYGSMEFDLKSMLTRDSGRREQRRRNLNRSVSSAM
jgi:hypothetical protein